MNQLVAGELRSIRTELRGLHRDGSDVRMALSVSLARDWQFRDHNLIVQAQELGAPADSSPRASQRPQ